MNGRGTRTAACSAADARTRLRQAELYLEAAELVQAEELAEAAIVATGNAVLAAIAAADAICCAAAGVRSRGQDHRQAIALLQEVTADAALARALRDVLDLKDAGHYGLSNVSAANCLTALRRARTVPASTPGGQQGTNHVAPTTSAAQPTKRARQARAEVHVDGWVAR